MQPSANCGAIFGFKPGQPSYDTTATFGIEIMNLALPAALIFAAAAIAWRYPITERGSRWLPKQT